MITLRFDTAGILVLTYQLEQLCSIPYFKTLLTSSFVESHTKTIDLFDEGIDVVKQYIESRVSSETPFYDICNLLVLADKWLDVTRFKSMFDIWNAQLDDNLNIALSFCCSLNDAPRGSPLKSLIYRFEQALNKKNSKYEDCDCKEPDVLEFLLNLKLDPAKKIYFIAKCCQADHDKQLVKSWLKQIDFKTISSDPKLFKMIYKSQNPTLLSYTVKHISSMFTTVKRHYNFDKVIELPSFNIDKLTFRTIEQRIAMTDESRNEVRYHQLTTRYEGCPNWSLKFENVPMKFNLNYSTAPGPPTVGTAAFLLSLDNANHQTLIDILTNMFTAASNELYQQRSIGPRTLQCYDPKNPEWVGFKSPICGLQEYDRGTGRLKNIQTDLVYVYSKVKTVSSRGLTTEIINHKTGKVYTLDDLSQIRRFNCVEGVLTTYVYIESKIFFIVNLRKAYIEPLGDDIKENVDQ